MIQDNVRLGVSVSAFVLIPFSCLSFSLRFFLQSLCRCLSSSWQACGRLVTPPLMMIVRAEEMISLLYLLVQGVKQGNQPVELKQAPPKPIRKPHGSLRVMLWQPHEMQGLEMKFRKLSAHSSLALNTP
jgi:hypothetical protein